MGTSIVDRMFFFLHCGVFFVSWELCEIVNYRQSHCLADSIVTDKPKMLITAEFSRSTVSFIHTRTFYCMQQLYLVKTNFKLKIFMLLMHICIILVAVKFTNDDKRIYFAIPIVTFVYIQSTIVYALYI